MKSINNPDSATSTANSAFKTNNDIHDGGHDDEDSRADRDDVHADHDDDDGHAENGGTSHDDGHADDDTYAADVRIIRAYLEELAAAGKPFPVEDMADYAMDIAGWGTVAGFYWDQLTITIRELWPSVTKSALNSLYRAAVKEAIRRDRTGEYDGDDDEDEGEDPEAQANKEREAARVMRRRGFPDQAPAQGPVNGVAVVDEIRDILRRHITVDDGTLDLLSLWCVHTYCLGDDHEWLEKSPRLAITSAGPGSGKSLVGAVISACCWRPYITEDPTEATLARRIDLLRPTLFLDERDEVHTPATALLNTGYDRLGGFRERQEPTAKGPSVTRMDNVFCACILSGIGSIGKASLVSRSFSILVAPRAEADDLAAEEWSRKKFKETQASITPRLRRWAMDHCDALNQSAPMPRGQVINRTRDNWAPLYRLSRMIGGHWPAKFDALVQASMDNAPETSDDPVSKLVTDIALIAHHQAHKHGKAVDDIEIKSADLVKALLGMTINNWDDLEKGERLTVKRLSLLLAPLGVHPVQIRDAIELMDIVSVDGTAETIQARKDVSRAKKGYQCRGWKMRALMHAAKPYINPRTIKAATQADGSVAL
jgi:hypothetical protein